MEHLELSPQGTAGQPSRARSLVRCVLFLLVGRIELVAAGKWTIGAPGWQGHPLEIPLSYLGVNAALLLTSLLLLASLDERRWASLGLWFYRGWWREIVRGAVLGGGLMTVVALLLGTARAVSLPSMVGTVQGGATAAVKIAALLGLGASAEEIAFRGYGLQRLIEAIGDLGAVATLSAVFGVAHAGNPAATPVSVLNTALAGALMGVAYLKTRGLWMPIGLHWAWNFFEGVVLPFPVSGIQLGLRGAMAGASGPKWFTGGAYGPEGSVVATVVMTAAIVWLWRSKGISISPAMREALE